MRPFRFRAQAALDLRRREHDRALVALAQAHTAVRAAHERAARAETALRGADAALMEAMRHPNAGTPLGWYRSWRLRLHDQRRACGEDCQAREADAALATAEVRRTEQRVRSLERLQALALAAWQREAARDERKMLDELAAIRFTRRHERSPSD